jgi:hypothetical protein
LNIISQSAKSSGSRAGALLQEEFPFEEKKLAELDSDDRVEAAEEEDVSDIFETKELINYKS